MCICEFVSWTWAVNEWTQQWCFLTDISVFFKSPIAKKTSDKVLTLDCDCVIECHANEAWLLNYVIRKNKDLLEIMTMVMRETLRIRKRWETAVQCGGGPGSNISITLRLCKLSDSHLWKSPSQVLRTEKAFIQKGFLSVSVLNLIEVLREAWVWNSVTRIFTWSPSKTDVIDSHVTS